MGPYRHILVPTDFSEPALRAVNAAIELAVALDAELTLTHVFEVPGIAYAGVVPPPIDLITPVEDAARSLLSSTLEAVRRRLPNATAELRGGAPWERILAVAAEVGADLIVMGTHGRSGIARLVLGSVAEKVVRHSPIPVLTVRAPTGEASSRDPRAAPE